MRRLLFTLAILATLPLLSAWAVPAAPGAQEDKKEEKQEAKKATAGKPRVAVFRLAGPVTESEVDDPLSLGSPVVTLKDLVARLKKAAADPEVKAVVLV